MRGCVGPVLLAWCVVGIIRFAHHWTYNYGAGNDHPLPIAAFYAFDAVRWTIVTLIILRFVQRRPAASLDRRQLWTVVAPLLLFMVLVNLMLEGFLFTILSDASLRVAAQRMASEVLQKRFHRTLLDVTIVLIIAYGVNIQRALAAEELRVAKLESAVTEARLTALRQQLQPHLLFNTLNAVSALVRSEPGAAERMLARLSQLLRGALRIGSRATVSLREDLAFAEAFVRIQEHRFAGGLRLRDDVDPAVLDAAVPAFLLQPLVENSIKHGLEGMTSEATIDISARAIGGELRIQVCDPALLVERARTREGFGVGLMQTRERLAGMYGDAASIELSSSPGATVVTVRMPLRFVD